MIESPTAYSLKEFKRDLIEVSWKSFALTALTASSFIDDKLPLLSKIALTAGAGLGGSILDLAAKNMAGKLEQSRHRGLLEGVKSGIVGVNPVLISMIAFTPLDLGAKMAVMGGLGLAEAMLIYGTGKIQAMEAQGKGRDLRG